MILRFYNKVTWPVMFWQIVHIVFIKGLVAISLFLKFLLYLIGIFNKYKYQQKREETNYSRNKMEYHRSCGYQRMIWRYYAQLHKRNFDNFRWNGPTSCKAQAYTIQNNLNSYITIKETEFKV